jgi:hypothetical protein
MIRIKRRVNRNLEMMVFYYGKQRPYALREWQFGEGIVGE